MKCFNNALFLAACLVVSSCNHKSDSSSAGTELVSLNIKMVDAPIDYIASVFVDIDHIEMKTLRNGSENTVTFGSNVGRVDLLTLQNGVSLPISELKLPAHTEIKNLRFILKATGHSILNKDGSVCVLKTPSQQQSGLKMKLKNVVLEPGHEYKMVVDFDAAQSLVITGNDNCLLKPVIRVKSLLKVDVVKDDTIQEKPTDDVPDDEDSEDDSEGDDYGDELIDPSEPQNPEENEVEENNN